MTANANMLLIIFAKNGRQFERLDHPGLPITDSSPILAAGQKKFMLDPALLLLISREIENKQAEYSGYEFHMSFPDEDYEYYYVILKKGNSDISFSESEAAFDHFAPDQGCVDDESPAADGWADEPAANIDNIEWDSVGPARSVDSPVLDHPVKHEPRDNAASEFSASKGVWELDSNSAAIKQHDSSRVSCWSLHTGPLSSLGIEHTHAHPNPLMSPKQSGRSSKHKNEPSWYIGPATETDDSWDCPANGRRVGDCYHQDSPKTLTPATPSPSPSIASNANNDFAYDTTASGASYERRANGVTVGDGFWYDSDVDASDWNGKGCDLYYGATRDWHREL